MADNTIVPNEVPQCSSVADALRSYIEIVGPYGDALNAAVQDITLQNGSAARVAERRIVQYVNPRLIKFVLDACDLLPPRVSAKPSNNSNDIPSSFAQVRMPSDSFLAYRHAAAETLWIQSERATYHRQFSNPYFLAGSRRSSTSPKETDLLLVALHRETLTLSDDHLRKLREQMRDVEDYKRRFDKAVRDIEQFNSSSERIEIVTLRTADFEQQQKRAELLRTRPMTEDEERVVAYRGTFDVLGMGDVNTLVARSRRRFCGFRSSTEPGMTYVYDRRGLDDEAPFAPEFVGFDALRRLANLATFFGVTDKLRELVSTNGPDKIQEDAKKALDIDPAFF